MIIQLLNVVYLNGAIVCVDENWFPGHENKRKRMSIFYHLKVFYEIFNNISNISYIIKQCKPCIMDK